MSRTVVSRFDRNFDRSMKFHKIMFVVISTLVILGFIAAFALMAYTMISGGGISYSVDYQFGNTHYSESYDFNN